MIKKLINALFLIKEIKSREGIVHFRRYRLFSIPWFSLYLHQILEPDKDLHLHDHPWNFISYVIQGHYVERCYRPHGDKLTQARSGTIIRRKATQFHCIDKVIKPTWTLVITHGSPESISKVTRPATRSSVSTKCSSPLRATRQG